MTDEVKRSRPSWQLKELGSRLVAHAVEKYGGEFYDRLGKMFDLNESDMDTLVSEVEQYYSRAKSRCPHIDGKRIEEFEAALDNADFKSWSKSAKSWN